MLTLATLTSIRVGALRPSCTAALRAVLQDSGEPLTLAQIRETLDNRWPSHELSAAIAKLRDGGYVIVMPPVTEHRIRGKRYVATSQPPRRKRATGLQSACFGLDAAEIWAAAHRRDCAGVWDGLVPAFATR